MIGRRKFIGAGLAAGLGAIVGELLPLRQALAGAGGEGELAAMQAELERGLKELRLPDAEAPYAAELRVVRADSLVLDGSYGGVISDIVTREALALVNVRVGSHERDNGNFFGMGSVQPSFALGYEPDPIAARKRLWLAMDQSYRAASAGYKAKLSAIDRLADKDLPDDRSPLP